ncbi:hypothetical protein LINPERPRIM_LOCUS24328 [Linum perenne]
MRVLFLDSSWHGSSVRRKWFCRSILWLQFIYSRRKENHYTITPWRLRIFVRFLNGIGRFQFDTPTGKAIIVPYYRLPGREWTYLSVGSQLNSDF